MLATDEEVNILKEGLTDEFQKIQNQSEQLTIQNV